MKNPARNLEGAEKVVPVTLTKPRNTAEPAGIETGASDPMTFVPGLRGANLGRRRVPRRIFESSIGVLSKGIYEIERSFQLGEGGMMIASARKLDTGQSVVVSFYLPTAATIVVRAIVRSSTPAGPGEPERYGIEFTNLGFQFKREIRNFVASASTKDSL